MKLFKMFKRGQKGFTLVELMVVMAIMVAMAAIVVPAVTGTKGTSQNTQLNGDKNAVQSAVAKFNNDSIIANSWPTDTVLAVYGANVSTALTTYNTTPYTAINWTSTTDIRTAAGDTVVVSFVSDFLPNEPISTASKDGVMNNYVWLLKTGTSTTDAPTQTVVVLSYNASAQSYTEVK